MSRRSEAEVVPLDAVAKSARPTIQIEPGKLSTIASAAERHLITAGVEFYQRGSMLVRPIMQEVMASDGRKTRSAALEPVTDTYMRDQLDQKIDWLRYARREKKWRPADAPAEVSRRILGRVGEWKFPAVVGIVSTPTLRPDGTVLGEPGYDEATRLILFDPPPMPPLPDRPTRDDGVAALKTLDELLDEFPFVDDASRSVALSALITPVVRGAVPVAPMHACRAPAAGSGKSYLLDIAAAVAQGEPCPVIAAGRDEAETEKRLVAAVLAGYPIVSIDNINGELSGDFLCQVIERPVVNVRVLGLSKVVRIPNRQTLFATGNNLRLTGDMPRRALLCSLDAGLERPEERDFKGDPVERVLADRGTYIAAALTIARGYLVAGSPGKLRPLVSFKGWSDIVRSALVWLDRADPVATIITVRSEDPEQQALAAMLDAWRAAFGPGLQNAHSAAEAIAKAQERPVSYDDNGRPVYAPTGWATPALRAAIEAISPRGIPDAKSLGKWLARYQGRIASQLCFKQVPRSGIGADWYVLDSRDHSR